MAEHAECGSKERRQRRSEVGIPNIPKIGQGIWGIFGRYILGNLQSGVQKAVRD